MKRFQHLVAGFVLLLALLQLQAHAQVWQWAQGVTPTGQSAAFTSAKVGVINAAGEAFTAYSFTKPTVIGGQTYDVDSAQYGAAVVQYDSAGNFIRTIIAGKDMHASALHLDRNENLYIAGRFSDRMTIGSSTVIAMSDWPYFIAKLTPTGALQWFKQIASNADDRGTWDPVLVVTDSTGNVTIGSTFKDTLTINSQSINSGGQLRQTFLAQFRPNGILRWIKGSTAAANPLGWPQVILTDMAAAPDGTLYLSGFLDQLNGSFAWNGQNITAPKDQSFFLKINQNGILLTHRLYGRQHQLPGRIGVDATGTAYAIATTYQRKLVWGDDTLLFTGSWQVGSVVMRLNALCTPEWVRPLYLTGNDTTNTMISPFRLRVVEDASASRSPRLYLCGSFWASPSPDSLKCGRYSIPVDNRPTSTSGYLLTLDGLSGAPYWMKGLYGRDPWAQVNAVYPWDIDANTKGQISVCGYFTADSLSFGGTHLTNPFTMPYSTTAFTSRMLQHYNLVQGTVFKDLNSSNIRDNNEPGQGGVVIEAQPGPLYFSSDNQGRFSAVTLLGNYTFSLPHPPEYQQAVAIGPTTANFSTFNNISRGYDFALQPVPNQQDLRVYLTPVTRARPGFAVKYRLTYTNVGTVPMPAGLVQLTFDPALNFVSSTPTVIQGGATLAWSYTNLQPGETRDIDVLCQLAVTTPLGHQLNATAIVEPLTGDLTPTDNTETATLTVTGSYDPNDIQVNYTTLTLPQVQQAQKALDYTIRFQNMGTDTAFSVVILDTLPTDVLNMGTFQMLAASHTCIWRLAPGGVLVAQLPDIRLPDRTTNTLRSMGFVRFRLVPRTTLNVGDLIPNQAEIHFDYNPPMTTNTALTEVVGSNGLPNELAAASLRMWPNPANGTLNVEMDAEVGAAVRLTLLDAMGRAVLTETGNARRVLDLQGLSTGLYLLRAEAASRQVSRRVVVR